MKVSYRTYKRLRFAAFAYMLALFITWAFGGSATYSEVHIPTQPTHSNVRVVAVYRGWEMPQNVGSGPNSQ